MRKTFFPLYMAVFTSAFFGAWQQSELAFGAMSGFLTLLWMLATFICEAIEDSRK